MAIAEFDPGPNEVAILPTEPPSDIRLKAVPRVGTKRACTHCLLAIPQGEVAPHGYCRVCLPEEGPPIEFLVEQAAVRACRAAGLRAMARPCAWEDCRPDSRAPCASCRPFHDRRPSPVEVAKKERSSHFTDRDESDLRRYFSKTQKTGIGVGSSSGFTMMCDRIGEAVNFKSKEQPQRTEPRCPICAAKGARAAAEAKAAVDTFFVDQRVRSGSMVSSPPVNPWTTDEAIAKLNAALIGTGLVMAATEDRSARVMVTDALSPDERDRLERDPVGYAAYASRNAEIVSDAEVRAGLCEAEHLVVDPDAVHFKTADELRNHIPVVIVGDETIGVDAPSTEVSLFARRKLAEERRGGYRLETTISEILGGPIEPYASPLAATHRHSKSDLEDFKPIRHYDREVIVDGKTRLVQVAVYPPSLEPLAQVSHAIHLNGASGAGKFGSWDDEAVDYVEGRSSETLVNRVLAKLPERSRDILEAFYTQTEELTVRSGSDSLLGAYAEVALVTEAAQKAHNDAAEGGQVATVRDVVEALKKRAAGTSTNREAAVKRLETMRAQAEDLVLKAQIAYAWAAAHS